MSTLQAARRKILKPSGFVHRARACALCAIAIVVEAICFVKEASACAVKPRTAHVIAVCFLFKRVPFLPSCVCHAGVNHSNVFERFQSRTVHSIQACR